MKVKIKSTKRKPVEAKSAKKRGRPLKDKNKKTPKKIKVEKTKAFTPIKAADNAVVMDQRRERQYRFDERLVPFYNGADTKDGNILIREALIKLGHTQEIAELFEVLQISNIDYNEEGRQTFIKTLSLIIMGFDSIGLANIYEDDVIAIFDQNVKAFDDYWDSKDQTKNTNVDVSVKDFVN